MASGRLRTVSPPDEELALLGQEMLDWLYSHPETLHVRQWYSMHKHFTIAQWKQFIKHEIFRPYYDEALSIVGLKYLQKSSDVDPNVKNRWQRIYFGELRDSEDEDLDAAAARSRTIAESIPPTQHILDKDDVIMTQQAEIAKLKELLSANKPKTSH